MSKGIYNLHNHTPFSDGAYTIDELCEAHLDTIPGIRGIGISDNLFCTPSSREIKNEKEFQKLFAAEKQSYAVMVDEARQQWAGRLKVFCGAEINWPLNKTMLPQIINMVQGLDYVLFEFVDWAGLTTLANQAKRFPCPVGLVHNDVAEQFPNTSMDQIVRTLANARIFVEISPKFGELSTSHPWFSILPNHRVKVALGTDTHDDLKCLDAVPDLADYLETMGLGEKIFIPEIPEPECVSG